MRSPSTRRRAFGLAALALGASLTTTEIASADDGELPVGILTIQTLDAFEQADGLTGALRQAVNDADGWSTAQLQKDYALLVLINSLGCPETPDAACEQKIADEIKVDRFLWGQMKKVGADVVGELHLWERGKGSKATPFKYSANLVAGDPTLLDIARSGFVALGGGPPLATVTLRAGSGGGSVLVDGKPSAKLSGGSATFEVPKGSHTIRVEAPGYDPIETRVELAPREAREIALSPTKQERGTDVKKILGFTSLGLGVAAGGVAGYAGVRVLSVNSDLAPYRDGTDPDWQFKKDLDGCDPAGGYVNIAYKGGQKVANDDKLADLQSTCKEGRTMQTLTLAMWPAAGALAGTGILLLALSDWGSDEAKETAKLPVQVLPVVGPGGAFVSVSAAF